VAEAWLIAQDPYLKSDEFGQSIDEVENLIKKHEAFEKAAAAQEERFAALERLTTFELKDMKRRQEEEQRQQMDTLERQKAESRYSRDQPDTRSDTSSIRETKSGDGELEGMLVRKHEWESTTKKASNRSWDRICVVMKQSKIFFYKDQKTYRTRPEETFRGEAAIDLLDGSAEAATDYTKKKHVFRLRLANGGDYLFQAHDDDEMTPWVNCINQVAMDDAGPSSKSQTLPSGEKKDEPKRRSFFTLKKN
jgi:spectrin beta